MKKLIEEGKIFTEAVNNQPQPSFSTTLFVQLERICQLSTSSSLTELSIPQGMTHLYINKLFC